MGMIHRNHVYRGTAQICLTVVVFLILTAPASHAAVWYVNAASTAAHPNGKTWATAYPAIQSAVDTAASVDEVWVAKGTYTGTSNQVVTLKAGITLYGGFSGTEATRDQRDRTANPTIIDGEGTRRCVTAVESCVVDGCTLQNGNALDGGGMYQGKAIDSIFIGNTANGINGDHGDGGGMFSGTAINCNFAGNMAKGGYTKGGGMYLGVATNCTFSGNHSSQFGGGTYDVAAIGCTFSENGAGWGGGMYNGTAANCTFSGNSAGAGGGTSGTSAQSCTFQENRAEIAGGMEGGTADNCIFIGNSAINYDDHCGYYYHEGNDCTYAWGGGMLGGTATNCTFRENRAEGYVAVGGGMDGGTATTCVFYGNRVTGGTANGGGMYGGTAINCTFFRNEATGRDVCGGGMCSGRAVNSIIWGNAPNEYDGQALSFSCLSVETAGTGNISADPGFVNPLGGDFRLRADSPCLDAGTPAGAPAVDILGRVRPQGAGIDMGAYEYFAGDDLHVVVSPAVLRVDASSTAVAPDGLTWETAFPSLQAAADRGGQGTELWVAQGTYTTDSGVEVVYLRPGTSLYGGFAGTESTREARSLNAASTIIDGQGTRRCVTANLLSSIDSITLQDGHAEYGGGMYWGKATNCVFVGNSAKAGGGLGSGTATGCIFTGNFANTGGGACDSTAASCTFRGNLTDKEGSGGGMYYGTANNCIFNGNAAGASYGFGGGMKGGAATNCIFTGNSAKYGSGVDGSTATNCIFWRNLSGETHEAQVSFSCLSTVTLGTGNIVACPDFVNPSKGDFRLRANSPCVDAGTSDGFSATDFLGRVRPRGAAVDMGAFEYYQEDDEHAVSPPAVLHVNAASTAALPDGLTWETAFSSLQEAVDLAGCGTEIWVAQGTYAVTDGTEVVRIGPSAAMYGGFTGTETERDQRNWVDNASVIDGQASRRCVTASNVALVDGFTLKNGISYAYPGGGGMYRGTAANCIFSGNVSGGYNGGGLQDGTAANCTFIGNRAADDGGGMSGGAATNCTFLGNTGGYGGGMYVVVATGCTLSGNTAMCGGGMSGGTAVNCMFSGNTGSHGGGMEGGQAVNCTFTENTAATDSEYGGGGGMFLGTAINCVFIGNSSQRHGGGMRHSTAVNCTFFKNFAQEGGGADVSAITNCVLWENSPDEVTGLTSQYTVSYSCLSEPVEGVGNIVADPLFVDADAGDFRLQTGSPCIDAGTGAGAPSADILGVPRPQGANYDMGASEVTVSVTVPDLSGLARTTAQDLVAAAQLYAGKESEEYHHTVPADHVIHQTPIAGTQVPQRTPVDLVISRGPEPVPVPDVVGQTQDAAMALIVGADLAVGAVTQQYSLTVPAGNVIFQSVPPGTQVLPDTAVDLVVSRGGIAVPNVVGQTQDNALVAISSASLVVGTVTQQYSATVPAGAVISQTPAVGTPVLPATAVSLVVSRGVQPSVTPNVVGQPRAQAESSLTGTGLVLGTVTSSHSADVAEGSVISQSPEAGTEVPPVTAVSIVVSLGPAPAVEGEGEGEGGPVDSNTARQELAAAYASADANGDGKVSFDEAAAAVSGLTQAVFNELDTDGDGQLSLVELGMDEGFGCTVCQGEKSTFSSADYGKHLGDLFLLGLGVLGLAALSAHRYP